MPKEIKLRKTKQIENKELTGENKRFVFDTENVIRMNADQLTAHVMVRLTKADAARLAARSAALGVKPTTYVRIVLLSYLNASEAEAAPKTNPQATPCA